MSMINDALRRAQTGKTPPPTPGTASIRLPSEAVPPIIGANPAVPTIKLLEPVDERRNPLPMILTVGFLLFVIAAAGAYWWAKAHGGFGKTSALARTPSKDTRELSGTVTATFSNPISHAEAVFAAARNRGQELEPAPTTAAPAKPSTPQTPSPVTTATPKGAIVMGRAVTPPPSTAAATASAPAPAAAATPASAVPFPPLRLQSIYYRSNNPSVMINGRTLYVNDEFQGVTIASIQPASVTLVLSGRTNILTLR